KSGRRLVAAGGIGRGRGRLHLSGTCAAWPRVPYRTGRLGYGKPCGSGHCHLPGDDPLYSGVNLVGGHTGGTFYIRARLRAGACVPVVSETLGRRGPLRVAEPLAVWTLSLRSPDSDGCGLLTP